MTTTLSARVCHRDGCTESIEHKRPLARWCSGSCRVAVWREANPASSAAHYEENREKYRQQRAVKALERHARLGHRECARERCNVSRVGEPLNARFCSGRCQRGAYNETHPERHRTYAVSSRARSRGSQIVELFHPNEVHERFGWTCQRCHEVLDPDAPNLSAKQPVVDHIIAIADLGEHSRASRSCNVSKENDRRRGSSAA